MINESPTRGQVTVKPVLISPVTESIIGTGKLKKWKPLISAPWILTLEPLGSCRRPVWFFTVVTAVGDRDAQSKIRHHPFSSWEKAMAPHSRILAWKIPWMEEPGGLQSMGSLRVRNDWATSLSLFTFMHWRRKWQPTPVFLPGESQRQGSLVTLWGRTESDTTEVTKQQQQQLLYVISLFLF